MNQCSSVDIFDQFWCLHGSFLVNGLHKAVFLSGGAPSEDEEGSVE